MFLPFRVNPNLHFIFCQKYNYRSSCLIKQMIFQIYMKLRYSSFLLAILIIYYQFTLIMENRKLICLSLADWPIQIIPHANIQLTPITKKILKSVHLKIKDLLPQTFQSFISEIQQQRQSKKQKEQQYHIEMNRRKKKIIILADIRNKYIQGKQYNEKQEKTRATIKEKVVDKKLLKSNRPSQIIYNDELNLKNMKSKTKTRNLSKTSSSKICFKSPLTKKKVRSIQNSGQYFLKNPSQVETVDKVQVRKGSSKKSKILGLSRSGERFKSQYFDSTSTDRMLRLKSVMKKEGDMKLCKQLIQTLQKWQKLDNYHMNQLSRNIDLSPQQKQRLAKIQSIEKIQLRKRIKRIKSKLSPQSYY